MKSPASLSLLVLLALAGCAGGESPPPMAPAEEAPGAQVSDLPVKLGAPYQVGSVTYTPDDPASYDEVGFASFYGAELEGRPTARGEPFLPQAITAAHRTLPLPSYVEVTALDTGRTILVRVNDRGPFVNDRLIDLSEGAARQLGIMGQGHAGVRVRRVSPIEQERALLRAGMPAAVRIDTPEMLLRVLRDKLGKLPPQKVEEVATRPSVTTPRPAKVAKASAKPVRSVGPVAASAAPAEEDRFVVEQRGGAQVARDPSWTTAPPVAAKASADGIYGVQVAAFGSRARADALAKRIGARVVPSADGKIFRVRFGPYPSADAARAGLASARRYGYPGSVSRD